MSICVCRFPVPVFDDPATLLLEIFGNNSQTHMDPEQWFQCWIIGWYQQMPGRPPQCLLSFYSVSEKDQHPWVPSCVSGSKDASVRAGLLIISGLQSEDKADYYCVVRNTGASHSDTGIMVSRTKALTWYEWDPRGCGGSSCGNNHKILPRSFFKALESSVNFPS